MQTEQEKDIYAIWLSFGVRAKDLLNDVVKVQLDDFKVQDFEYLQVACQTTLDKLKVDLENHLKNYPD